MKLLMCPSCTDVVLLRTSGMRSCECGKSSGQYTDSLNAVYHGEAIPIGFSNPSVTHSLRERDRQMHAGIEAKQTWGIKFDAFFIPTGAPSVTNPEGFKPIWDAPKEPSSYKTQQELDAEFIRAVYGSSFRDK